MENQYGIGAKLLRKMGYVEGQGLGKQGEGIAEPVQAHQRPAGIGLGMLSFALNEVDTSSDESDAIIEEPMKPVHFNAPQTQQVVTGAKKINSMVQESINGKIAILEKELNILTEREQFLLGIKKIISNSNESLLDKANAILQCDDSEITDNMLSRLLREELAMSTFILDVSSQDPIVKQMKELVEILSFTMDTTESKLNHTQSLIYGIIMPPIQELLYTFDIKNEKQLKQLNLLLIEFGDILEFINCKKPILNSYVYPHIQSALKSLELVDTQSMGFLRNLNQDLLDDTVIALIQGSLQNLFTEFCETWDGTKFISEKDVLVIKTYVDDSFMDKVICTFVLPRICKEMWKEQFDPLYDLDTGDETSKNFITIIRRSRTLFLRHKYNLLLRGLFGEINNILYEFSLFGDESYIENVTWWCNWLINSSFGSGQNLELWDIELHHIKFCIQNLRNLSNMKSQDYFDLSSLINELDLNSSNPNIENFNKIAIENIQVSFFDVLQDFCDDNNLILEKLTETSDVQLISAQRTSPIYKISTPSISHQVIIKDDILWLRLNKKVIDPFPSGFKPIFLWQLYNQL